MTTPSSDCYQIKRPYSVANYRSMLFIGIVLFLLSGCVIPSAPYRLLSDEVIGTIKSPPYSLEQVKQAQITLRRRLAARLSETTIQSELKSFACLIVSQKLDPTSARGKDAPSELTCSFDKTRRCAHRCKRSRLPREFQLAKEYDQVAELHDQILWQDLEAISQSGSSAPWEKYLTDCLSCTKTAQIRRLVCLRDLGGIELTDEHIPHQPLDRWLNQCNTSKDPEVKVLLNYRKQMLTPPEDLPYPLQLALLPVALQDRLTTRVSIGEAMRLARGPLDGKRIENLINASTSQSIIDERWLTLKEQLKRRLDSPLMPCLEHGLETCIATGQIQSTRDQAPRYLKNCTLCEHKESIRRWRAGVTLDLESVWRSHQGINSQAVVRHTSPSGLLIREQNTLTRLSLSQRDDRLLWLTPPDQLYGQTLTLWSKQQKLIIHKGAQSPLIFASTPSALYALDAETGENRWSYRYPFTKAGQVQSCLRVDPIPSGLLGGSMSNGGALCYQAQSLHFLTHLGEQALKLTCPDTRGCGTLVNVVNTGAHDKDLDRNSILIMSHPIKDKSGLSLSYYRLNNLNMSRGQVDIRNTTNIDHLDRSWLTVKMINSQRSGHKVSYLIGIRKERRKLNISLIDLNSGQLLWEKPLMGKVLINRPSIQKLDSPEDSLIGCLTDTGFYAFKLKDGSQVYNERLRTPRAKLSSIKSTNNIDLSWRILGDRLILLHPLNQALYYTNLKKKLSKQSLKLDRLDPKAYLTNIDAQWVIVSPSSGLIYGVPSQLDQVIWTWRLNPFEKIDLSRRWALVQTHSYNQLFKVLPRSLDELAQTQEIGTPPSACALGDRWDCLIQGDALIGIDSNQTLKERKADIIDWFNQSSNARSFKEAKLTKIDAMVAQSAWSAACQWGIAIGCTRLGLFAELGFYTSQAGEPSRGVVELKVAFDYYQRGAQLGDQFANERKGSLLELGRGVPQDYLSARRAYFQACEAGLGHACARWGFLNELGLGGAPQYATALTAYKRACKDGSAWACERLKQKAEPQ